MLSFFVRLVSGLCIGAPLGCVAYLAVSLTALDFDLMDMLSAGLICGFAAFMNPGFVISGIFKTLVWNKI